MRHRPFSAVVRETSTLKSGVERLIDLERGDERVPATWMTPGSTTSAPAVLLLHGLSSNKERMASSVGRALLKRGVASLALDLPMHGERSQATGRNAFANPLALVGVWRNAVREVADAVAWLGMQPEVNPSRLGVIGYSLGGFLALMTAADEPRLRVVALAAAGDLPDATPYAAIVRRIVDPLRAVRRLAGRSLLLVNGRRDTRTRPAQAERLFSAAQEPKTMLWYDGGHWPASTVIDQTAQWVASRLGELTDSANGENRRAV